MPCSPNHQHTSMDRSSGCVSSIASHHLHCEHGGSVEGNLHHVLASPLVYQQLSSWLSEHLLMMLLVKVESLES